jgi:hypothetical protein
MIRKNPTTQPDDALPDFSDLDREDLACAGLRRADAPPDPFDDLIKAFDKLNRMHRHRVPRPDGLRTQTEAAERLGCSIKTLSRHVASGALRYVALGHGMKRPRKMFADVDLDEFVNNQTRKDVPCPPTASRARRSGTSISRCEVIGFTAQPRPQASAKPKK